MLSCDEALELISARLDGPLSEEEDHRLEEHLSACPACRALSADLEVLHQELPGLAAQPPAGLTERVMDQIHASKVTPFQGKKRQWRWRSLASLAAVLAIVVVGAGTMNQWRTDGMLGTEQGAGNASLAVPASGDSEENAAAGEIAPAATEQSQPEITTGSAQKEAGGAADQGDGQSGSAGTQDSRSMPSGGSSQETPATVEPTQIPASNSADIYSVTPNDRNVQTATANGFTTGSSLTKEEALRKLAAWLGWNADELTVSADGTMTGPTGADGTTTKLICAGLNESGTGWLCQLEQVTPGPDGTASCTGYTVPLDGGDITQP